MSIPDLKDSINYLGEIVGSKDNEDMLDLLFFKFLYRKVTMLGNKDIHMM